MKDRSKITREPLDEFADAHFPSRSGSRPISAILQETVSHLTEIIRSEIRLARAEIRQDVTQVAKASLFLVVGAVFGLYMFGFVLLSLVYALGNTVPPWASALIVGAGLGTLAAIFVLIGRKKMKHTGLRLDDTIQSLQENVTWVKKQKK